MNALYSQDGKYMAVLQEDGNFVVYRLVDGKVISAMGPDPEWQRQPAPVVPPTPNPSNLGLTPGQLVQVHPGPFHRRLYSYWANSSVAEDFTYTFASLVGQGPQFFRIYSDAGVEALGNLVGYGGETEGWYFDAQNRLYLLDGNQLLLVDPSSGITLNVALDVGFRFPGHDLWQPHSSDDGQVHSATLRRVVSEGRYPYVGTVVNYRGELKYFKARGDLDESILTGSGEYLLIQEDRYNRIIRLSDEEERLLTQEQGAVGHCDTGYNYVVGEDDAHGACVRWDLDRPLTEENRQELFRTWNMGHVSVKRDRILHSDATQLGLVTPTGYKHLLNHGAHVTGDYDTQVRANLSPCATRATFLVDGALYVLALPPT